MKFFDPWIGSDYIAGIDDNKIFAVGIQHWCDPTHWHCNKTSPNECLEKCDKTCTVWNRKEYEKNKECNEWVNEENRTMPKCPFILDETSKYNCKDGKRDDCLNNGFRFLHCETKIAVFDHINDREKTKRSQVFECLSDALNTLFKEKLKGLKEKEKKEYCFDRIIFANYIQHYTQLYRNGRLDLKELQLEPQKDKEGFKNNLKKFGNKKPDIIIVLQEEAILKGVENIVKGDYIHLKEKDEPKSFYVLAKINSQFYNENYKKSIEDFIQFEIENINNKYKNDGKKAKVSRGIATLVFFIIHQNFAHHKKTSRKEIAQGIVDSCLPEIKKIYYKNGNFKDDFIRYFSSNKVRKTGKHITDEELENITNKYNNYMKKDKKE